MFEEVKEAFALEVVRHPKTQVQDMVKLIVQSCTGVAHLHLDENESLRMFEEEKLQDDHISEVQYIGNGLCRVPLSFMETAHLPLWNLLFMATMKYGVQDVEQLNDALAYVSEHYELSQELLKQAKDGVHHSDIYRDAYQPHYRLIKQSYVNFFAAILYIWIKKQSEGVTYIAIDGRCASGKSTLSKLVEEIFDVQILHLDDYFLPVSLRSENRLNEIGGNIDYDRFLKEVIESLLAKQSIPYRRYDCSCDTLSEGSEIPYQKCIIWEGSYAHHPKFKTLYNAHIFLSCASDVQKKRLKKRSLHLYDRFVKEWIPMEEAYFHTFRIEEQSNLVIDTSEF